MKKLIICSTPFQIIVALNIKKQYANPEDQVDLIITNSFSNYAKIAKRIEEKELFSHVIIANVKTIIQANSLIGNISKMFYVLFPKKIMKKVWKKIENYDELYCWNYDAFTASIRSYYAMRKNNIKIFIFDEGYISYFPIDDVIPKRRFIKIIEIRNELIGLSKIKRENIDGYLLFEPELLLFKPNCKIYKLDRNLGLEKEFKDNIDYIFESSKSAKKYDRKYIIFEEAMLANQKKIDDEKIFDEIINIVGKENAIIKLHPRTNNDRFTKKGIKTLGNDGIPWEAIALCGDFSKNIFITIGSGSVTSYRMLFGNNMKAYMLFKFIKPNMMQFNEKYYEFWEKMKSKDNNSGILLPETNEEFHNMLKKELEK